MVERSETVGDVALDEPHRPVPLVIDLSQRVVTTPARTKTGSSILTGQPEVGPMRRA
jgi:hypothetical protein